MILLLSFWIAEWGVIRTDADFLGPSCHQRYLWLPIEMDIRKLGIILEKPVIYFYGELPETLILHLGLSEIGIAYPPPHDSTNGFTWLIKKPKGRYYPDYKHRLALRFDMLEREADFLLIGDSTIRFIYYDAPMVYDDSLDVIFSDSGALALNRHSHTLYDVRVCMGRNSWTVFDSLGPEESSFSAWRSPDTSALVGDEARKRRMLWDIENERQDSAEAFLMRAMMRMGFTQGAAEDFTRCWVRELMKPGAVFWRLPQPVVDSLIPLSVAPRPEKALRAIWVLTNKGKTQ